MLPGRFLSRIGSGSGVGGWLGKENMPDTLKSTSGGQKQIKQIKNDLQFARRLYTKDAQSLCDITHWPLGAMIFSRDGRVCYNQLTLGDRTGV